MSFIDKFKRVCIHTRNSEHWITTKNGVHLLVDGDGNPDIIHSMKNDDYEIAKGGGRHNGFFEQWSKQKKGKIEKSIKSLSGQVKSHNEKIANPTRILIE